MSGCQNTFPTDYVVLSPVGCHKAPLLERWIDSIKKFELAPKEIIICIDWDAFDLRELYKDRTDIKVLISPCIDWHRTTLKRIGMAREILRNYILKTNYTWGLWIDSDIICPPDLPTLMFNELHKDKPAVLIHSYLGRNDSLWGGSGIMLTHRGACHCGKFFVNDPAEPDCHVSEDYVFLSVIAAAKTFMEPKIGFGGVSRVYLTDNILHFLRNDMTEEEVRTLTLEIKSKHIKGK